MCNCDSVLEYIDLFILCVFIHSTNIYPAPTKSRDLWLWSQVIKLSCEKRVKRVWVPQPLSSVPLSLWNIVEWKANPEPERSHPLLESQGQQCSHLSLSSSSPQPERINQSRTEDRRSARLRGGSDVANIISSVQFRHSGMSSSLRPQDCSTPGLPVHHQLLGFAQTHSIESVMPSNHLILCHPLLLLPSIFPSIRVFSNESVLCIRWSKYWSFSFSISPSSEYSGLILDHKISQERPRTGNSFPGNWDLVIINTWFSLWRFKTGEECLIPTSFLPRCSGSFAVSCFYRSEDMDWGVVQNAGQTSSVSLMSQGGRGGPYSTTTRKPLGNVVADFPAWSHTFTWELCQKCWGHRNIQ